MRVKDLADYSYCKRKVYLSKKLGFELLYTKSDNLKFIEDTIRCITNTKGDYNNCADNVRHFVDFIKEETNKLSEGENIKVLFNINLKSNLISGKIDELIITDNEIVPIKFKIGNNSRSIWDSEKIIMIAYSYLVQNSGMFKGKVRTAKIFYADKTVKTIHINELSFKLLKRRIEEVNSVLDKNKPPKINNQRGKCEACSFKDFCYSLPY